MRKIFVSYRRDDSADVTGRICDQLNRRFGADTVFMDVDDIPPGVDFRTHIRDSIVKSDVLLAIVGTKWLHAKDSEGNRRLENPKDLVRIEIETALAHNLRVFPIYVHDAEILTEHALPDSLRKLAYLNSLIVGSGQHFRSHVDLLIGKLEEVLCDSARSENRGPSPDPGSLKPGICPECSFLNSVDQQYCAKCGEPLKEPCLNCEETNLSWCEFCVYCGANIVDLRQQKVDELQQNQARCEELLADYRFSEAISLMEQTAESNHPRLKDFTRWAAAQLPEARVAKQKNERGRDKQVERAAKRFSRRNYLGALELMQQIPRAMHSSDTLKLLQQYRDEASRVNDLIAEAQRANLQGNPSVIWKAVTRLSESHSEHRTIAEVITLSVNVTRFHIQQLLSMHDCDAALGVLEEIPESPWTSELLKLREDLRAFVSGLRDASETLQHSALDGQSANQLLDLFCSLSQFAPNHPQLLDLRSSFSTQIANAAKERYESEPEEAIRMLDRIPNEFATEEIANLRELLAQGSEDESNPTEQR